MLETVRWHFGIPHRACLRHCEASDVDVIPLPRKVRGEEFAQKFEQMLDGFSYLEIHVAQSTVDEKVRVKVTEKLAERLATIVAN